MLIPRQTATMLIELQVKIRKNLGVSIGYIHPKMAFLNESDDFIVRESEDVDDDDIQLLHRDDILIQKMGTMLQHQICDEPGGEDKVQELLDKINEAILAGVIYFDPIATEKIDGIEMSITKKLTLDNHIVFDVPVMSPQGTYYYYDQVIQLAQVDKRFDVAKQIVDKHWPEIKEEYRRLLEEQKAKEIEASTKKIQIILGPKETVWSRLKKFFFGK